MRTQELSEHEQASGAIPMSSQDSGALRSWWKLVLTGLLAIAFGIGAILLPADIMFGRIVDVIFGIAKPLSAGMTAVAALLALVALVAVDSLVNLFGTGVMEKRASRIRGVVGIAVLIAAVFWPDQTVYAAVELIGLWAIFIGVLELIFARAPGGDAKNRALLIIGGIASICIGVGVMKWAFAGALLVSAVVGIAAAARGVCLIVSGIRERTSHYDGEREHTLGHAA